MTTPTISAYEGLYQGEKAVWLKAGRYVAAVLPEIGANLIAFRDVEKEYHFLREPTLEDMDEFKQAPVIHGLPILFPPNRYEDGKFPWKGNVYQFPINEAKTGNHLHGFVHNIPWKVERFGSDETESFVTLSLTVNKDHSVYKYLPHDFTIRLQYSLRHETGLLQHVSVHNEGTDSLPCLLAFHTTLNAPFAPDTTASDYRFRATIGQRWELNHRMLPTGQFQPLTADEEAIKGAGVSPYFAAMDNHYTSAPQNGRNRMELTNTRDGVTLVYDVGTAFKQWMIWNNYAKEGFFCPEPQINLVNAPNVAMPAESIGLLEVAPGDIWSETSRLFQIVK